MPQIVTLRHQGKECHAALQRRRRGGGRAHARVVPRPSPAASATRAWSSASSPTRSARSSCLARSRRKARLDLLRYGIDVLSQLPNATIYLEGAASDWTSRARVAESMLRYIGVAKVRGFMLNVTHYDWTSKNIAYGRKISRLVGGKHVHRLDLVQRPRAGALPRWLNRKDKWRRINVLVPPALPRPGHRRPPTQTGVRAGRRLPLHRPARATPAPATATAARCPIGLLVAGRGR